MLRADMKIFKKPCNILKYMDIWYNVCLWLYSVANQAVRRTRNIRVRQTMQKKLINANTIQLKKRKTEMNNHFM
jgi:hypothetical protein